MVYAAESPNQGVGANALLRRLRKRQQFEQEGLGFADRALANTPNDSLDRAIGALALAQESQKCCGRFRVARGLSYRNRSGCRICESRLARGTVTWLIICVAFGSLRENQLFVNATSFGFAYRGFGLGAFAKIATPPLAAGKSSPR